ncbi:hypothetical protein K450DRAFT_236319 [Umbelopsis ramanniana AG]|uniref:Uncharacterized protein n=1 Tax=Umbelopsis ramanniana AG TaxID=1314678 RepID=A0AAD5EAY3_UMBRA|nr:uncharacterized protein K450DRAFT_236319 [Umbelopsis ramanniana AG]KAI8580581.1 hypothetical protein K450DRAFT_236319 [Umbelopsis ramanniana AG]
MKSTFLLIIAYMLAYANAQASSTCLDAAVFNLCIKTQQSNLNSCGPVDYNCLCQWQKAILTCYNVCTDTASANQAAIQQGVVTSICGAASIAVPPATNVSQTSASVPSQTMAAGPSSSNLPLTSSGSNGTSSGSIKANPSATIPSTPPANTKSEGTHAVSSGIAIVLLTSSVLYFIL